MASAPHDPEVTVREFSIVDYDEVIDLWRTAELPFRPQGRDRRSRLASELGGGRAIFLVAEGGDRLVGTVLGTHDGRKGWINRLAVAPDWRRRGVGRLLVKEVEVRLEALGLEITAALVESSNETSVRFFQAIGYDHDPSIEYLSRRRSPDT